MPGRLIDGKQISLEMLEELAPQVRELIESGTTPGLAVVLVGEDPASQVYVRMKHRTCESIGIRSVKIELPSDVDKDKLLATIDRLNADSSIHGILVQLPLPSHIDSAEVLIRIDPAKDVDGFHPINVGRVASGDPSGFKPATPYGVQQMLVRSGVEIEGAHAVILGRSNIVGRPMASLLLQTTAGGNATVTVCHSRTRDLGSVTRLGDILIVAIGKPKFVTADMVAPGAVVIDVGVNRVADPESEKGYRLVGDVDFEPAREVASAITPVPGGVGPMTITMLLHNTVQAARQWAN